MNSNAKTVFITGGTGSVGKELVKVFASHNYLVYFQYNKNMQAAEELTKNYDAVGFQIDYTSRYELPKILPDILINNAAINISDNLVHEVRIDDWDLTYLVNVKVPFLNIKSCLPEMISKKWGRIINISSIYGFMADVAYSPYISSKHALIGLTKSCAREYAKEGITCNAICPGPIKSELIDRITYKEAAANGMSQEDYVVQLKSAIPAQDFADPADVAFLSLFLATDEAGYMNGASIPLDGGLTA